MTKSSELRAIICAKRTQGKKLKNIGLELGFSFGFVRSVCHRFAVTHRYTRALNKRKRRADAHLSEIEITWLVNCLLDAPDLYMHELCRIFKTVFPQRFASIASISAALKVGFEKRSFFQVECTVSLIFRAATSRAKTYQKFFLAEIFSSASHFAHSCWTHFQRRSFSGLMKPLKTEELDFAQKAELFAAKELMLKVFLVEVSDTARTNQASISLHPNLIDWFLAG